ncbi:MAG: histidinol-phosphate transaminase [Herpetosiphonaceae bacterium]|nr:histidinol-phosphate transaminase [Herpetosiphonaceae bacterium]
MIDIAGLVRPDLQKLVGYTPIVPLDVLSRRLGIPVERLVKLDANENPYGPSPRVLEALAHEQPYAIYPDPDQTVLRAALSEYTGQPVERLICGNGSDELIDLLMRLCLSPGDAVVESPPTFGMYSFNTAVVGGRSIGVPRHADWTLDVDALIAAVEREQAKLVFLPSPNNPDGSVVERSDIMRLLALPALLVIDEAYAEFAGVSVIDLVGQHPNLVVLRTFSKWAGLAGLRLGYGAMDERIVRYLLQIKPPYNINVAAQAAVLASLADRSSLMDKVALLIAERERLYAALCERPACKPLPSRANFVLFHLGPQAGAIKRALEQEGVLVRYYSKPGLNEYLRVTVGTPEQNLRFLDALDASLLDIQHEEMRHELA